MTEKKTFNWITVWLLGAVTCGLYTLYVWYVMAEENNKLAEKYGIKTIPNFIVAYLLGCVTCGIYLIYWMYKFMSIQAEVAEKSSVQVAPSNNPIVLLLLSFVPIYSFYMLCDNYNRTVEAN